jgi:hypothetical protein
MDHDSVRHLPAENLVEVCIAQLWEKTYYTSQKDE